MSDPKPAEPQARVPSGLDHYNCLQLEETLRGELAEAEQRIARLEEALDLALIALLSGNQLDGMGERYEIEGVKVFSALKAIRAALAATEGETP